MVIKFKKLHEDAKIPTYAHRGDAAVDLYAIDDGVVSGEHGYIEYSTGLSFEIEENYVGLIFPRSSVSNYTLNLCNSVGVIDSNYRGPVTFRFKPAGKFGLSGANVKLYSKGDRIGQLLILPIPKLKFGEVQELSETGRGSGSYGSSGS